jgi:hypothetical protein
MVLACPTFDASQDPEELFQWIMNSDFFLKVAQHGSPDQMSSNPLNSCSQYLSYASSPVASTYSCIHSHIIRDLSSPEFLPFGVYHAYVGEGASSIHVLHLKYGLLLRVSPNKIDISDIDALATNLRLPPWRP